MLREEFKFPRIAARMIVMEADLIYMEAKSAVLQTFVYIPRDRARFRSRRTSSGSTAVLVSLLASFTRRQKCCALVDVSDGFDPEIAGSAGVDLDRLLWVRCGSRSGSVAKAVSGVTSEKQQLAGAPRLWIADELRKTDRLWKTDKLEKADELRQGDELWKADELRETNVSEVESGNETPGKTGNRKARKEGRLAEQTERASVSGGDAWRKERSAHRFKPVEQALKAADILVQNGGLGLIAVDLSGVDAQLIRKVPLSTWFRFARVVEKKPTALVIFTSYPVAQSCADLTLHLLGPEVRWTERGEAGHTRLAALLEYQVEGRARFRKEVQSAKAKYSANALWILNTA
jgi:hypothetical protein